MTKEECASKLHLLQQEYDELREKCEQLEIDLEKKKVHSQEWCDKAMEAARDRQSVQQDNQALQRWKEEAKVLLNPIFEYAQDHPDMKIGGSMTEFVLNRCKEYDKLKKDIEGYELKEAFDALDYSNLSEKIVAYQVEYDKLKVEYEKDFYQAELNYEVLLSEHAALQSKADVLATALQQGMDYYWTVGHPHVQEFIKAKEALASYNSNTNNKQGFINLVHAIAEDVSKDRESAEAYLKSEGVDVAIINAEGEWLAWKTKLMSMVSKHTGEWPVIKDAEARKYYDDGFTPEQYFRETWQNDVD